MPYEEISDEQFEEMASKLKPLDFSSLYESKEKYDPEKENYCDNDSCKI